MEAQAMPPEHHEHAGESGSARTTRIGGFEILTRLGSGGMGAVFKARQVSMDRVVALKVLPPELAKNEQFVERFIREARSAAKLNHPNIVQGIDVGHAEGHYYFAMEFVDGSTVRDLIGRGGRIDEKKALNIIGAVARALEHAHRHGIIHRDIKPDNIMINREGVVKLADLGLARSTEKPDTLTIEGTALGTPYYMSPEQVRGETDVDTRADIYALGATLYHMVTGEFPYEGPNAGAIMARHLADPVPSAKQNNPDVSRATDELIQRMMAKDRDARPRNPAELLAEIRDALAGKVRLRAAAPTRPTVAARPRAARAPRGGKPAYLAAAGAVVVLAAIAIGVVVVLRPAAGPERVTTGAARGAFAAAEAFRKENPEDFDGAIARLRGVHSSYPDTQWAERAAAVIRELETAKAARAARERAKKELATLRSRCRALAAEARFGQALKLIGAFAKKHPTGPASGEPAKLQAEVMAKAEQRYTTLLQTVHAAIKEKDFAKARQAIQPVATFGIPELAEKARKKLAEIASREKHAEQWAKWDEVKAESAKLAGAGKYDEALQALQKAKAIELGGIGNLIAEEVQKVEDARRKAQEAAISAYLEQSDKLWTLFKKREYARAEKVLADLAKRPGFKPAAKHLRADLEAATLLKEFWAAVERGVVARKGKVVSIAGRVGNVEAVKDGKVTLKVGAKQYVEPLLKMDARQAAAIADLKDDERSSLLKGVFLLAQGEGLDAAERALAAAGNPPPLWAFNERLTRAREAAAREAWEDIQRAAAGRLTAASRTALARGLADFERAYGATEFARQVADQLAALRRRLGVREAQWSKPFGTVGETVQNVTSVGHCVQVWRVLGDYPPGTRYRVSIQHALAGKWGGFRICAWADTNADGVPDTRIGLSKAGLATKAGEWSTWEFHTRHRAVFVGNCFPPGTQIYYESKRPVQGCTGLDSRLYCARRVEGPPTEVSGTRYTNIKVQVKVPPPRPAVHKMKAGKWQSLFDGKRLRGWRVPSEGRYAGHGKVHVKDRQLVLQAGVDFTGIACTRELPDIDYEISMDAMRVAGSDAFCILCFPVGDSRCAFVVGGMGGSVTGLQLVDGVGFEENVTARRMAFQNGRWYGVRLRVTRAKIEAWIDREKVVDLRRGAHSLTTHDYYRLVPLGVVTWKTTGALRNIRIRRLGPGAARGAQDVQVGKWQSLFDGKTLNGWQAARGGHFKGNVAERISVADGCIVIGGVHAGTGVRCTRDIPRTGYELAFDVMCTQGGSSAGSLIFPVGETYSMWDICTGGGGPKLAATATHPGRQDAASRPFKAVNGRWYRFRVRVERDRVQAWIDDEQVFDCPTQGYRFGHWAGWNPARPLGFLTCYSSAAKVRNIRLRRLGK